MPALIPEDVKEVDQALLEELDLYTNPKCDNEECERDATHLIRCHCRSGVEFSCFPCIMEIMSMPGAGIQFDPSKSCGHMSSLHFCEINPL
jgi:hypothetical protein